jgi:L-fuconate dehydratase
MPIASSLPIAAQSDTGYTDEKIAELTHAALNCGFTHFKMKVGSTPERDLARGRLIRSIIDGPASIRGVPLTDVELRQQEEGRRRKNAGPTGCVLMLDANQVWDVGQAIENVKNLAELRPWSVHFFPSSPYPHLAPKN